VKPVEKFRGGYCCIGKHISSNKNIVQKGIRMNMKRPIKVKRSKCLELFFSLLMPDLAYMV
jgi:hypothetical protein